MFRILGFIIGSAVSIGALVMLVGMPDFHLTGNVADEDRYDVAIKKLKEKQQAVKKVVESVAVPESTAEKLPDVDQAEDAVANVADEVPAESDAAVAIDETDSAEVIDVPPIRGVNEDDIAEPEWHAFWNPFRSEIAARGFVRRLESVTGLDYRVVKVKQGVYQVAFSYSNDTERDTKLSQIAAATGLDVSDSLP